MGKNQIIAVSGGVDSVVLLDMVSKQKHPGRLIVAHVNHGIREESGDDAYFVELLARQYGLPYLSTSLRLGPTASEDVARQARYDFLFEQAKKYKATILTAHHQDDLVGSIAINIIRGTGIRGLRVMNRGGVSRPLLGFSKQRLYDYALSHRLEWVEDKTNSQDIYLRNRLRAGVLSLSEATQQELIDLRLKQLQLMKEIEREVRRVVALNKGDRYFYTQIDTIAGIELLRQEIGDVANEIPLRPNCERALLAIKTARPGTKHDVSGKIYLSFTKDSFIVHKR